MIGLFFIGIVVSIIVMAILIYVKSMMLNKILQYRKGRAPGEKNATR